MGRRRQGGRLKAYENVEVIDAGAKGKAVARVDDKVVFITGAVPGDVCDIQVTKKKKSFLEARPTHFHKYSDKRIEPFCDYFGVCGGCKWQFMSYENQLFYKNKEVVENLKRLGKVEVEEYQPILASKHTEYYRNKLEYTFSNKRWLTAEEMNVEEREMRGLGFHVPGRFDKVVDINHCYLQQEPSNAIRNFVRDFAFENDLTFFDIRNHEGFLRNLIIRSTTGKDLMVIVAFYHEDVENREALLNALDAKFPEITSLMYVINGKANDSIGDQDILSFKGNDHIIDQMPHFQQEGEIKFKIGPKSFYQTNAEQAHALYQLTAEFSGLKKDDVVYDLYTGTGTIANFVAPYVSKVVGVEYVPEAIEDAFVNSKLNGIDNTDFYAGDMKDVLNDEFIEKHGKPSLIITDPPRAGMHDSVVNKILEIGADTVVYVSCNSATQARDLSLLQEKYKVVKSRAVDMFPHTYHVENVVRLELR
ncbi:23S rRNA (uracil(1939)-C(5))-methyltransferase RlmD [Flavobacteriales bacterium]|nr:23S rRNA (uracil(1939)-C(5))-methyltransferase RlmD [Flavobacteriales bacterium]